MNELTKCCSAHNTVLSDTSVVASTNSFGVHRGYPQREATSPIFWFTITSVASLTLVYILTWISFSLQRGSRSSIKVPPMVPYMVPFVGHAFSLLYDPVGTLIWIKQFVGARTTHGLKVFGYNIYFIYGPDNVAKMRKHPTTPVATTTVLKTLFGMSSSAVDMYTIDGSGIDAVPKPGTQVLPYNRVDYLTHANFHKHLMGKGLSSIYRGFATSFTRRLPSLNVQDDWTQFPDLFDFWLPPMTSAMNEGLAGPLIECINPDFANNLLKFYPYLHSLMKGMPRWWIPEAYELQKSLIHDVATWQAIARGRFRETDIDPLTGRDPWWGSAFMRERQGILQHVDHWDHNAIASSDFGIFWGSSVNIHPMAVWGILEIFKAPQLLCRVRTELENIGFHNVADDDDVEKLLAVPLLQSIYSELLRLRVEVQTIFFGNEEDFHINEWRIPRGSLVVVPAGDAHRDEDIWNTKGGQHPLNEFWSDRFLAYTGDPLSGPRNLARLRSDRSKPTPGPIQDEKPRFTSAGLTDTFMPFGIGERTCPGRGFARREIITICALVAHRYDIELVPRKHHFETTKAFYGIGTQRPKDKIPFKIRLRKQEK